MSVRQMTLEEASQISGAKVYFFDGKEDSGRITLKPGYYYAIIANSPPSGIVMSKRRFPGSEPVGKDANYRIGKIVENSDTLAFYYPYER